MNDTLKYYKQNLDAFITTTYSADMSMVRNRFTKYLQLGDSLLDAGCGSGRDTKAFITEGYQVTAIDACKELCDKASELTGQKVLHKSFVEIDDIETFDGIWACASLLHVPSREIGITIDKLIGALKEDGILYMSFKYGEFEGVRNGRYFTDYTEEKLLSLLREWDNLIVEELWVTEDTKPIKVDNWLNIIIRKGDADGSRERTEDTGSKKNESNYR